MIFGDNDTIVGHEAFWIELELCEDCNRHKRYSTVEQELKYAIAEASCNRCPVEVNPRTDRNIRYPRIGACEVHLCLGLERIQVYSKLFMAKKLPVVERVVAKIEKIVCLLGGWDGHKARFGSFTLATAAGSVLSQSMTSLPRIVKATSDSFFEKELQEMRGSLEERWKMEMEQHMSLDMMTTQTTCKEGPFNVEETMWPENSVLSTLASYLSCRTTAQCDDSEDVRLQKAKMLASGQVDFIDADPKKWSFPAIEFDGTFIFYREPDTVEETGEIMVGIQYLTENPSMFDGIFFESSMTTTPKEQQKYTLIKRTGSGFRVEKTNRGGFTWIPARYNALPPQEFITAPQDEYTDSILLKFENKHLQAPLCPGRGQGVADRPGLTIVGNVDPSAVNQGSVRDSWLMSAISSLAEHKGAVEKLFKNTKHLKHMPQDSANSYTVTLYDLPSGKPVNIVVDERLCSHSDDRRLLASNPSVDGQLWVCYLEKAVAAHCGGWDNINGGTCLHGWRLMTGVRELYEIRDDGEGFSCFCDFNPNSREWQKQCNSPADSLWGMRPIKWPQVGGGIDKKLSRGGLFERMCTWCDKNYMLAFTTIFATHICLLGVIDEHAYTILECVHGAGGSKLDMIKVRDPWGTGGFNSGKWDDDGPGWSEHPDAKAACKPAQANDIFWLDIDEFFTYFDKMYLCCQDMSEFATFEV